MNKQRLTDILCALGCLLIMAWMMWLSTRTAERELRKFDQTFHQRSNK